MKYIEYLEMWIGDTEPYPQFKVINKDSGFSEARMYWLYLPNTTEEEEDE